MASVSSHPHLMASPSQLTTTPIEDEAIMNNNNNNFDFNNDDDDGESISISIGCDDSTLDTFETPAYHHHNAATEVQSQRPQSQSSSTAMAGVAVAEKEKEEKMKRVDAHDVMSLPNFYPRPSLNHSHNHNINNHSNNHNCKMNNEGGHSDEISIVSSRSVRRRDVI